MLEEKGVRINRDKIKSLLVFALERRHMPLTAEAGT